MMKRKIYVAVFCFSGIFFSCENLTKSPENEPIPAKNDGWTPLSVRTDMNVSLLPATRGTITTVPDTAKIGTFISGDKTLNKPYNGQLYKNILLTKGAGNAWDLAAPVYLSATERAWVFAYYPYNAANNDGTTIPIEAGSQTDYLYGVSASYATATNPVAVIRLKHALAVLKFRIYKEPEVPFSPVLTRICFVENPLNMFGYGNGKLNIETGKVTIDQMPPKVDVETKAMNLTITETIPTNEVEYPELLVMPMNEATATDGEIGLVLYISGTHYVCKFPAGTKFESGKKYTYIIKLTAKTLSVKFYDVADWTDEKTENIDI